MKLLRAFILFILCALAQSALAAVAPLFRTVRIDFCLIALVAMALRTDEQRGLLLGVLAGLATDLLGGGRLGVCALGYGAVGFVVGGLQETVFKGASVIRALLVVVAAIICSGVIYYVLRLYGPTHDYLVELWRTLLPSAAATAVVGTAVLVWMERRPMEYRHHD
jgi:rod shape-determining protein MreD